MSKSFKPRNSFLKILVLQNSLKSPFLPSQILCNFLGIFPQIFLPPESLYSISNPILIQKSIKIDFLLLFWISARAMVSARPPPFFSSPAAAHLLPPFLAQSAHHLPLTDRWAHPNRSAKFDLFCVFCLFPTCRSSSRE
jgi:hypothetical protein